NLLNRHPAIGLCDETYYFYYVYRRRRAFGDLADPAARQGLADRYLATRRMRRLGLQLDQLAAHLLRDGTSYDAFFTTLLRFYADAQGKRRPGEKTPQHALFVEELCQWYPTGRIIHLVRDPRDVVASLLRMPWGGRTALANARLWRTCVAGAERARRRDNYLVVCYEDLVRDTEAQLRRICDFVGEEYLPQMTAADASPAPDAWWFARAREPISSRRQGIWRAQLTSDDVAIIEWAAGALMRRFGYEPCAPPANLWVRLRALTGTVAADV